MVAVSSVFVSIRRSMMYVPGGSVTVSLISLA
jgi:hypothetical protein